MTSWEQQVVDEILEQEDETSCNCYYEYCPICGHDLTIDCDEVWKGKYHQILQTVITCWCDHCGWEYD